MKRLIRCLVPPRARPHNYLKHLVHEAVRDGILNGPFKGMRYPDLAVGSAWYPKLLGTYELELYPVIEEIIAQGFRTVIDIGAAEGYYACGIARALPQAHVVAFEADLKGRYLLEGNIRINALQNRVTVRGFCDPALLSIELQHAQAPILIICDAEGYENDLLSPAAVSELKNCWIMVELHESFLPGLTDIIKDRFAATHQLLEYTAQPRTRADFPIGRQDRYVQRIPFRYLDDYLNEHRPAGMTWLWMKPNTNHHDP